MSHVRPPLPLPRVIVVCAVVALLAVGGIVVLLVRLHVGSDVASSARDLAPSAVQVLESPIDPTPPGVREDTVQIEVPAESGLGYRLRIGKGATLYYTWKTNRGLVLAELHGEPAGDTSGYYEDYTLTHGASVEGSLETPFEGCHGWYWKNENDFPVTLTLSTRGIYTIVGTTPCSAASRSRLQDGR